MVARSYENLGAITGVSTTASKAFSLLGNMRDRYQTLSFDCFSQTSNGNTKPFSGVISIQGSQDTFLIKPVDTRDQMTWFDIAEITFVGEVKPVFVELEIEMAHIRIDCIEYVNYVKIAGERDATVSVNSEFTLDGTSVSVSAGATVSATATAINDAAIANITASSTTVPNTLVIEKTDGTDLTIEDVTGTAMKDLGIISTKNPTIYSPGGRISSVKTVR